MGGIYVHIPFCRKACIYCDFHFSTQLSGRSALLDSLHKEIQIRKKEIRDLEKLNSLYVGGGTPSVVSPPNILRLIEQIQDLIPFQKDIEISLEANPEDLSPSYLKQIREVGVNRLSVGIQTFSDEVLSWMNRSHTAAQSIAAISQMREAGFSNFSADLIFGNPGLDLPAWQRDIDQLLALQPPHISVYALTVEEKTALAHHLAKGKTNLPDDTVYQAQFLYAHERLVEAGYEHYELSNYALPGFRSQHNSAYWEGIPYVGLGPSAHSFDGLSRAWNVSNNALYNKSIQAGTDAIEEREQLSPENRYHEYLMTHFRKASGIDLDLVTSNWVPNWKTRFEAQIAQLIQEGYAKKEGNRLSLTPRGWLISDKIISDFF